MRCWLGVCFLWLLAAELCAGPLTEWVGPVPRRFCGSVLQNLLAEVESEPVVWLGTHAHHPGLLQKAGMSKGRIEEIEAAEKKILSSQFDDPVLQEVIAFVKNLTKDEGHALCLVPGHCAFSDGVLAMNRNGYTRHFPVENLESLSVADLAEMVRQRPDVQANTANPANLLTLLRPGRETSSTTTYLRDAYHELAHISQERLLEKWVEANLILISRKKEPDLYFRKYVKVVPNEPKPIAFIDKDFYVVWGESRSELVEEYADRIATGTLYRLPIDGLPVAENVAEHGGRRTFFFSEENGIREGDFFAYARRVSHRMHLTLEEAGIAWP